MFCFVCCGVWGSGIAAFIEIVKGLGAKNVLTESFDRNVLTGFPFETTFWKNWVVGAGGWGWGLGLGAGAGWGW